MNRLSRRLSFALALTGSAALHQHAQSVAHAATVRTVALSGQSAPGTPGGVNYRSLISDLLPIQTTSVLNDAGQAAFYATLTGSGVDSTNGEGIWSEGSAGLALVARTGNQAPGTPSGMNFADFNGHGDGVKYLVLNDAGQTAFRANAGGGDGGIWSERSGSLALVADYHSQVPGTPSGVNYDSFYNLVINNAGQTGLRADLNDGGEGIWSEGSGGLALVARIGSQAPGVPNGVNYNGFVLGGPKLNNAGQIAFSAFLTGNGVDSTNNIGIWSERSGSLALVARSGSQAPGTPSGVTYNSLGFAFSPALNDAGQIAFRAGLTGSGVDTTNNRGIWSEGSGSLAPVVRSGTQAPGAPSGVSFAVFLDPVLNNAGQTAFFANLTGPGVDSTNTQGIWSEGSGTLALVARTGSHAPGTPVGVNFISNFVGYTSLIKTPVLNDAGQTAFQATLTGNGVDSTTNIGIWATDLTGALQLIARTGDPLEVVPGDFRTISGLSFAVGPISIDGNGTGDSDGLPSGFNNLGQLVFSASFTDGSSGVFVSNLVAVPEPRSLALAAIGILSLVMFRLRSAT